MKKLLIDGMPKRITRTGYEVKAVCVCDDEEEMPVLVRYDYMPQESAQGNPDLPNPGPGQDSSVEITEIIDITNQTTIDPTEVDFDEGSFIEATQERLGEGVNWNRRMAGM